MPNTAIHRSQSTECLSSQVQSCLQWRTRLLPISLHVYPSFPMEVLVQTQITPLCFQMRHPFHPHPRHRHTNMSHYTSPNPPLWHTIYTSRQIPGPGTRYLRRFTGWQIASSNNFSMLRCRSSRSARLPPAMDPFRILHCIYTFHIFHFISTKESRRHERYGGTGGSVTMLYSFRRLPIDQAFPRRRLRKTTISFSTSGQDRTQEVHCNPFHFLRLHGARACSCWDGGVHETCCLAPFSGLALFGIEERKEDCCIYGRWDDTCGKQSTGFVGGFVIAFIFHARFKDTRASELTTFIILAITIIRCKLGRKTIQHLSTVTGAGRDGNLRRCPSRMASSHYQNHDCWGEAQLCLKQDAIL